MKIAHVLDNLCIGGAERVVLTLSALQIKQGHSVEVHYLFASGPLEAEFAELGVQIYSATAPSGIKIIARLSKNFKATKPDVAHFHNATTAIYGSIAATFARVPVKVSTRHGLVPPDSNRLRETKFWLATRLCYRTVAVSSQTERNMRAFPLSVPSKVCLIVNGSFPAKTSPMENASRSDLFTFVHVARLNPVKNQAQLLEAFAAALAINARLRLIIVGDGLLQNDLEQLAARLNIADNVLFVGATENVGNWLAVSDCFILSSLTEGTPISLLEALAAGLPCIVTEVGEMPVVVAGCRCGLIVPPGNAQKLTEAMLQISSMEPSNRLALGQNARIGYETHFQPEAMAARYFELYRKVSFPMSDKDAVTAVSNT